MIIKAIASTGAIIICSGCASMLTHITYTDSDTEINGARIAAISRCAEFGFSSKTDVEAFKLAFSRLLTVSVYDEKIYADSQSKMLQMIDARPSSSIRLNCQEFNAAAPAMIIKLRAKYMEVSADRRRNIGSMLSGAAAYQTPTFGMPQMPTAPASMSAHRPANGRGIGWTPVTSGNMQWGSPKPHTMIQNQIGQIAIGSDGSKSYQFGDTSVDNKGKSSFDYGSNTVRSDGSSVKKIGDTTYERMPDGTSKSCKQYGDNVMCSFN